MRRKLELAGELNLVPYMDIVVNLILFLMLSTTSFVPFGVIDARAPEIGPGEARPSLHLSVAITPSGYELRGEAPGLPVTIAAGDYAELKRRVVEIKRDFAQEKQVLLQAQPDTPYAVVLAVMDATRNDGAAPLFPDVTIMR